MTVFEFLVPVFALAIAAIGVVVLVRKKARNLEHPRHHSTSAENLR